MLKLKHLFENVWFGHQHLSKKMYTMGLIAFVGVVAVAVVMLGVNGFAGTKHIDHVIAYESEEEEPVAEVEQETLTNVEQSEESQSLSPQVMALSEDDTVVAEGAIAESDVVAEEALTPSTETDTEAVSMMREEDGEETAPRTFRTQVNNIEEAHSVALLSLNDYTALVRIVEAEATGEDLKGKILIANVVMNRVESSRFPDSIYDVVHQKLNGRAQFSPIDDGRYYTVKITDSTIEAVEQAISGVNYSEGALFFVAKPLASDNAVGWFDRNLKNLFTHGVHTFYKYH